MNFDKQLRASHLILGYTPVYSTWQLFGQALLVDRPLLSYIDVRLPNFLLTDLIVGEAQDLGPRLTRAESLVLMRNASTNIVFQGLAVHRPVEETGAVIQPTEQAEVKAINSFEVEAEQEKGNMVTRRTMTMTMERFILSARPPSQLQQTPS